MKRSTTTRSRSTKATSSSRSTKPGKVSRTAKAKSGVKATAKKANGAKVKVAPSRTKRVAAKNPAPATKPVLASQAGNGNGNGKPETVAKPCKPKTLPRTLASPSLKTKDRLVVVFQGGSPLERMQVANQLADKLEKKVYRVDLRPCISRFIGETEKNIDRIFHQIEPDNTLLYFDEADSLFGKEPNLPSGCDRSAKWWVPHLNKRVKEFHGAVLFATNNHSRNFKISRQFNPVVARIS